MKAFSVTAPVVDQRAVSLPTVSDRRLASIVESAGGVVARYGLALVLVWIGGMKFTSYEANGIKSFVENSPLMSWTYPILGVQGMSNLLGVVEIVIGLLIASRMLLPKVSALASLAAAGMFLTTLSFIATTPGAFEPTLGFPGLSVPGQFLLKDVVLLGVSLWTAGEAWGACRHSARTGSGM